MKPYPLIAILLVGCAGAHSSHVTAPSTASVRSSVDKAQAAAQAAQQASTRGAGSVNAARSDSDRILIGVDRVDYKASRIRSILNGGGHP